MIPHQGTAHLRARAEQRFKAAEIRASKGAQALRDAEERLIAERGKTERLRSLRLEKEKIDEAAAAARAVPKRKYHRAVRAPSGR